MSAVLAVLVGFFYAAGLYLILRRSVVKLLIGLVFLGHAANLLIFAAGGLTREKPPLISAANETGFADPLPQAFVLTAIVIGFGVLAFAVVLVHRVYQATGTDDIDELRGSDR